MKVHAKKKSYRWNCKQLAKAGQINTASGTWISRSQAPSNNSMTRDYHPQR